MLRPPTSTRVQAPARAPAGARLARRPARAATMRPAASGCPVGFGESASTPEPASKVADLEPALTPPDLANLPRPTGEFYLPVVGETLSHSKDHLAWAHAR
jgi:hypothetical protein